MNATWARRLAVSVMVGEMILTGSTPIDAMQSPLATATIVKGDTRTFATFVVNGEERGEHIILLKADGVYASIADLRSDGVVVPHRFEQNHVDQYVNVKDLAPDIAAVLDLNGPTLRLDAASASALARTANISLGPAGNLSRDSLSAKSGYLNYSVRAGSAGPSAAEELVLSDTSKTFYSGGTFDGGRFRRGMTNLNWTSAAKRRRTMIGDVVADSGDLGSVQMIAGVNVARASDVDFYGHPFTTPTLHGAVLSPSTADVYINGQIIRSLDLAPGTYDFSNLPGSSGVTNATIVLRDSFGHTQALATRYYGAASVLAKGTTDYSFSAGEARSGPGSSRSFEPVALGRYRLGVTESTTLGAHAEFAPGLENLGATLDRAGRLGVVGLDVAESRNRGALGLAGSLTYTLGYRNIWLNASVRAATPSFTSIAQRGLSERTISEERFSIGIRPFPGSYTSSISYGASYALLGGMNRRLAWQHSVPLQGGLSLMFTTGISSTTSGSHHDVAVYVFRSAGRNPSVPALNASIQSDGTSLRRALELQRVAPLYGGSGYDVSAYPSGRMLSAGRYALRSSIGNVDMDYDVTRAGSLSGNIAVSGAVAFAGPYVHMAQPISDSFAVVKVEGGERVKVLLDNQETGMTDHNGLLILPNLRGQYSQRVGIVRDDGPVNLNLTNADQSIVMASRHGGVTAFAASVVTAVIGKVLVSSGTHRIIPAFGQLSLKAGNKSVTSELDRDGQFYLEDVTAGSYPAVVRYGGGECQFMLEVPRSTRIEQSIGEVTCAHS